MTSLSDLATIRRAYARQIMQAAHVDDPRLEAAFADVPREAFLGPGPWALVQIPGGYKTTPDTDPIVLYQDAPVSILADKRLNNGQPSFVAMLIGLCAIREGDRVVHVGAGTGYYTAMISRLAGLSGGVLGIECETELARRAARNLEGYPNTAIVCGDGWTHPLEPTDAILVNAGTPRPAQVWLDALKPRRPPDPPANRAPRRPWETHDARRDISRQTGRRRFCRGLQIQHLDLSMLGWQRSRGRIRPRESP